MRLKDSRCSLLEGIRRGPVELSLWYSSVVVCVLTTVALEQDAMR